VLFALLGIQISYPKIFRMLAQESDFWMWNTATANKFQIDLSLVAKQIESFGDQMKQKTDEQWEQVIYGFCQKPLKTAVRPKLRQNLKSTRICQPARRTVQGPGTSWPRAECRRSQKHPNLARRSKIQPNTPGFAIDGTPQLNK
jgi:hypothetical protein